MRELFDALVSEGEAGIQRLIDEEHQETVQLDFKAKKERERGNFAEDDKRVFGKVLSAFANSSGGLIVWGVDCRKNSDGVDCAQKLLPIANIELFRSEASRLTGELLMPRHDGVLVQAIPSAAGDGSGYLLVQVERSERRPHRSEAKGDKQYYKRAGDNSYAMEHHDVEDAFRRIILPKLELEAAIETEALDERGLIIQGYIYFFIRNVSDVSAKMPYLQIRGASGAALDRNPHVGVDCEEQDGWTTYMGGASFVVHPGMSRKIAQAKVRYVHSAIYGDTPPEDNPWFFEASFRFGCENVRASVRNGEIALNDLKSRRRFRFV